MKKFIYHSLVFSILAFLVLAILVLGTTLFAKKSFDYSLPENKNILVIGDSHTECAIDDRILNNAFNLSQSATCYFYTYLKTREVINHNPQIDTLIVSYSYSSLKKIKDKWLIGPENLKFKIRDHLFLFNSADFKELFLASPKDVLVFVPQVIAHNFKVLRNGYAALGAFDNSERNNLREDLLRLQNEKQKNHIAGYSKYQEEYLLKIYNFCKEKNIKLILVNTPIHPKALEKENTDFKSYYCKFYVSNMPSASLLNHADFNMPDSGFGDAYHLDYKGAKIYTEYLMETHFSTDISYCNELE